MFVLSWTGPIELARYAVALLVVLTADGVTITLTSGAPQPSVVATRVVHGPTSRAAEPSIRDLNALEAQLRATTAIGIFTKISIKNQVDDLMKQFREYHEGKTTRTMTELRWSYDLLIMKVLLLLQDTDHTLASAIVSSREAIWIVLSDQNEFANL